ncbi:MAG: aspartate aminotransferase family protein [Candidatus Baldrarchaeia archaeon]
MAKFNSLHFPNAPQIIVEPPGPVAKEILEKQGRYEGNAVLYPHTLPFVPEEAKGATIKDVDGNIYIDFLSGISVLNFGSSNPVILEKTIEQLRKLTHTLDFPSKPREELAKRLVEIAPGELKNNAKVIFGGPTGSDAVEAAIKLAKYCTKRYVILAFEGSYHGQTTTALALSSGKKLKEPCTPLGPEIHFAPYAYCYRCPFKLEYPECGIRCAEYVEHILEDPNSGVTTPAAIIVEPIQGEGGIIVPPDEFLKKIREITKKYEIPLIIDEIQSGMGRTGKWFACEHANVTPDIMTVAKSVGGIGLPLAGILYNKSLDVWVPGSHMGTFRGNVVAMAAGAVAIDFANETKLLDHVEKLGEKTLKYLKDLAEESKYIGEVRGKGLMIGIEIVKDKETKEPSKELTAKIQLKCFKKGLIVWKAGHYANVVRFLPPLVITEELMEKGLEIFRDSLKEVEKE